MSQEIEKIKNIFLNWRNHKYLCEYIVCWLSTCVNKRRQGHAVKEEQEIQFWNLCYGSKGILFFEGSHPLGPGVSHADAHRAHEG